MRVPGELYTPSTRPYRALPDLTYAFHDWTAVITHRDLCFGRRKVNVSQVFAGQQVGVRQVTDRIWLVEFPGFSGQTLASVFSRRSDAEVQAPSPGQSPHHI
jgi:hypothetical protein